MRAFVVSGPGEAGVAEVPDPVAKAGEVVVEVERVGVCGTDVEFFTGVMQYLHDGHARYPMRLGHEWMGRVCDVGQGVDAGWLGRRVTADTMLGCGSCQRCESGRQHVCDRRTEIGIRGGRPGALAEWIAVPARALHALPDPVDASLGALAEPGGNALRCVQAADLQIGERLLVFGPGTIGLLVAMLARARGAQVHLVGVTRDSLDFARSLGFEHAWTSDEVPGEPFDAVVDASHDPQVPARAIDLVDAGWQEANAAFPHDPAARQIFEMEVDLVQTSCGYGVPRMGYVGERDDADLWAAEKGPEGIRAYWAEKNRATLDGFATGIEANLAPR